MDQATPEPAAAPSPPASFWIAFGLAASLVVLLRLYRLESLQQEFYGDIDIVQKYVLRILAGQWPFSFQLSAGPLYHYLIIPIVRLAGSDYAGLKLASALVSLAGLAWTYAFTRRLVNDAFALLTTFIAGISSWLLIFSRLGNSQILLPWLTMLCLWLVVRIIQGGRLGEVIVCAGFAALGLYVYPQSFILPVVIFFTLAGLHWTGWRLPKYWAAWFILVTLLLAQPFLYLLLHDPVTFSRSGYIVDKFLTGAQPLQHPEPDQ